MRLFFDDFMMIFINHGLAEEEDENVREKAVFLGKDIMQCYNMKSTDIDQAYRLRKSNEDGRPRNVFVKFKAKKFRDEFNNKRKLTSILEDVKKNVYANEDLTKHRAELSHNARKLVKFKRLHSCWTQLGNIMTKRTLNDKPQAVYMVYDHDQLKRQLHLNPSGASDYIVPCSDGESDEEL